MNEFDDDYVRRLREGDRETAEHYSAHFRRSLAGQLYRHGLARGEADDVIQDVLVRGLEVVRSQGVRGSLPGLMRGICENVVRERRRKENRTDSYEDKPFDVASGERSALQKLISKEEVRKIRQVFAKMPKKDAAILRAIFIDERDKDEVCREFGVDRNYLRVLLFRAKNHFRELW